jgi:hypothetical protein
MFIIALNSICVLLFVTDDVGVADDTDGETEFDSSLTCDLISVKNSIMILSHLKHK